MCPSWSLFAKLLQPFIHAREHTDNHPSRTLAAHQTPKVRLLNLPLTSLAVTRVSGSSRPCNSRAAICLLTGRREKQHIVNKQLSPVPCSVFCFVLFFCLMSKDLTFSWWGGYTNGISGVGQASRFFYKNIHPSFIFHTHLFLSSGCIKSAFS